MSQSPNHIEARFDSWVQREAIPFLSTDYPENREKALKYIASELTHLTEQIQEEERKRFVGQLKERKYLISKDGMAEEYLQELINDYEKVMDQKDPVSKAADAMITEHQESLSKLGDK